MTKLPHPRHPQTPSGTLSTSSSAFYPRLAFALAGAALLLCAVRPMHAQANGVPPDYQDLQEGQQISQLVDPPSRVGRLSVLQGNVSFQPATVTDFSAAELNYPLTTGDRLYTDINARAELEAGQLTVRLGAATDFTVTTLSDELAQFGLAQGSVHIRPYALDPGTTTEVDTPNASITLLQPGDLRVDVFPQDNLTLITVFSGQAQVNADGVQQVVQGGQTLQISGANPSQAQFVRRARPDALDGFSAQRDALYQQQSDAQGQYVNPATIGYSDLGQYGDWDNSGADDGGPVWYPRGVAVDWAPYRVGHWAFINPWGWTWVEAEPWGFAPFHYGRWARFGDRWGWVPGPPVVHPVYSPALVVFVGGANFRIGGGIGVAAWFPLGPREVYQPWYHSSPAYVNRVNVSNIYNRNNVEVRNIYNNRTTNVYVNNIRVNNVYVNRTVATTAVPQDRFASGRPVGPNALHGDPHQFDNAPVMQRPPMQPSRPTVGAAPPPRALPPVQSRPVLANQGARNPNPGTPGTRPQNGFGNGGNQGPRPFQPQPGTPAAGGAPAGYPNRGNGQGNGGAPIVRPGQQAPVAVTPVNPAPSSPGRPNQPGATSPPSAPSSAAPAPGVNPPPPARRGPPQYVAPQPVVGRPAQPEVPEGAAKPPAPIHQPGPAYVQPQPTQPTTPAPAQPTRPNRPQGQDQPRQQFRPQPEAQPAPQPAPQRPAPQPQPVPQPQRPAPQAAPQPQPQPQPPRPAPPQAAPPRHGPPPPPHAEEKKPDDKKK